MRPKRRNVFQTLILLCFCFLVMIPETKAESGNRYQNIYIDILNSSNMISINYNRRFTDTSVLGWRIGLGFSENGFDNPNGFLARYKPGLSLPLGVNALFGKHTSKFELGVGITPSLAAYRKSVTEHDNEGSHHTYDIGPTLWRWSCALGIDIGYRLQKKNGFMFRTGFSPCVDVNKSCISMHILSLFPYLSFGYTFN